MPEIKGEKRSTRTFPYGKTGGGGDCVRLIKEARVDLVALFKIFAENGQRGAARLHPHLSMRRLFLSL
jgi:hypothetical protein